MPTLRSTKISPGAASKTVSGAARGALFRTAARGNADVMFAFSTYGAGKVAMLGDSSPPDDGTGDMFGVVIAQFTKDGEPVYGLVAEKFSKKVTSISTPSVAICE